MNKLLPLTLLAMGFCAVAQPPAPPEAPLVREIPARASWEMRLGANAATPPTSQEASPENDNDPNKGEIQGAEIIRTAGIQKVLVKAKGLAPDEIWVAGADIYIQQGNLISSWPSQGMDPGYYNVGSRFYGTDWLKPGFFKGQVSLRGTQCHYYEGEVGDEKFTELARLAGVSPGERNVRRAWIDAATRLPVQVQNGDEIWSYAFRPAPEADLQLPAEIKRRRERIALESKRQAQEASVR